MICSSFKKYIEISLTDLIFQIKGHGGISIKKGVREIQEPHEKVS